MVELVPHFPVSIKYSMKSKFLIQFFMNQARFWILTIPHADFVPWKPPNITHIRGQLERGGDTGYLHWQICVAFNRKQRLRAVKQLFGDSCHAEPTRSDAAREYVWKDETGIRETR